jgi:hypothetical protein
MSIEKFVEFASKRETILQKDSKMRMDLPNINIAFQVPALE